MPGCKRRIDEDRWLEKQLKKFKYAQVDANVYASTLAKLRQGARLLYSKQQQDPTHHPTTGTSSTSTNIPSSSSSAMSASHQHHLVGVNSPGGSSNSNDNDTSVEEGISMDILADNEEVNMDTSFCEACTRESTSIPGRSGMDSLELERCNYCEKSTCHLNYCKRCTFGFCAACCISRYDEPSEDTFMCISCLNLN